MVVFSLHKFNYAKVVLLFLRIHNYIYVNCCTQKNKLSFMESLFFLLIIFKSRFNGCFFFFNQEGLDYVLSKLKDKHVVKPQDLYLWYMNFLSKSFAQETVWNWAKDNWDWIKAALGGDMSFDSFVNIPASIFKTQERLDQYIAFFEPQSSLLVRQLS